MTIEEITRQAAIMCGIEPEVGSGGLLDSRYKRLEGAVINGLQEAARVLRRKKSEVLTSVNGVIPFNQFSCGVIDVVALRKDGVALPWREDEDGIITRVNGSVEVVYVPCLKQVRNTDTPIIPDEVFPHRNYAYFAASEFLNAEGRHTDARAFDVRWKRNLHSSRGRMRIPYGGWL